jgi:hypothetical protein
MEKIVVILFPLSRVLEHSLWWSKEGIRIFLSTSYHTDLQFKQCHRSKSILRLLEIESDQPTKTKVIDQVITFARSLDSHFFMEYSAR